MTEELTEEEEQALREMGYGYPKEDEKQNIFAFFKQVIATRDTSRVANLTEVELGNVRVPVRTLLELSEFCKAASLNGLGTYFNSESQIISNTSLSREGFLDKLAVTQKREVERRSRVPVQNKGWFRKKQPEPEYV